MNCIPPEPGFLETLREVCTEYGAVLIFDEVMTGFRFGTGGVQGFTGITPDLTCLGKVIGGGMPVGAFGGKAEIMDYIAPVGPVYQAGTLSGNPVSMAAGLAMMQLVQQEGVYEQLFAKTKKIAEGMQAVADEAGIPFTVNYIGSMWGGFFTTDKKVSNYAQVMACDNDRFNKFFHGMLEGGVNLAPASYEAAFMSTAHTDADIEETLNVARKVFATL